MGSPGGTLDPPIGSPWTHLGARGPLGPWTQGSHEAQGDLKSHKSKPKKSSYFKLMIVMIIGFFTAPSSTALNPAIEFIFM